MAKTAVAEKPETLDSRIASALGSSDQLSSEFLLAFYNELDEAVGVADQTARECRAKSIDPLVRDAIAERSRGEDQEFIAARLRAAATPLRAKYQQALAHEAQAAWNGEATYMSASALLVNTFRAAAALDQQVDALNSRAPSGVTTLRRVEAVARGIPAVTDKPFAMQVHLPRLPLFDTAGAAAPLSWPPPQPNWALEYYESVHAAVCGAPPPPTDAERIEASQRQMAFVEAQERGRVRLGEEAEARARANEVERRRLAAGEPR